MAGVRLSALVAPRDAPVSAFDVDEAADVPQGLPLTVDQGFRGEHRLRKTDEFSSVFVFRRSLRLGHFELLSRTTPGPSARLGIVVAKKIIRSAVCRNLVKRIVRESFRRVRANLPSRDIVVRVVTGVDMRERKMLRGEIDGLFSRLMQ